MEVQAPKIAFTANAFVHALQEYGEALFRLIPKYGQLYVSEWHLCGQEEVAKAHLDDEWIYPLIRHWFDIKNPPPFGETDEIAILSKLSDLYPDNVIIVVDKLREYSRLNRTYANDDLLTVCDLLKFITN